MTDRPILFSGPMVRALLAGTKTQTRRVLKPQPEPCDHHEFNADAQSTSWVVNDAFAYCRTCGNGVSPKHGYQGLPIRFAVGDQLWVREAWRCNGWAADVATFFYRAHERAGYTEMCDQFPVEGRAYIAPTQAWKPGIHMPRWASRLTLTVTDVRVERLQDLSETEAIAEGAWSNGKGYTCFETNAGRTEMLPAARLAFAELWNSLNAKRGFGWVANPWVIAVTFSVDRRNIDEAPTATATTNGQAGDAERPSCASQPRPGRQEGL